MPRIIVVVQGGVVQEVKADQPVDALLIDHDVEQSSGQGGEGSIITDLSGKNFGILPVTFSPQLVEHYFKQKA